MSSGFRQCKWREKLIFEYSRRGRIGYSPREVEEEIKEEVGEVYEYIPREMRRKELNLPEVSQIDVIRHYTRLSQMNFGVDLGMYPLGSCTMKYTPRIIEEVTFDPKLMRIHPLQPAETVQGILEILYELSIYLSELTGMDKFSLQPPAGASGELTGALIMRKYFEVQGELNQRQEIIIPDSAHGTNPASARMAGFKVVEVPSGEDGCIDVEALKSIVSKKTAGLMITNPNTLGIFEKRIIEVSKIIHEEGGLLYYDGANLNAVLGFVRPGDMGFDIIHLNLHKTFSSPHGGGGPGAGPVGVKGFLEEFLPTPIIEYDGEKYYLKYDLKHSIGKVHSFYGNVAVLVKAYAYIRLLGLEGLRRVAEISVLNANYLYRGVLKLRGISDPFEKNPYRKHEFVVSLEKLRRETGVTALDVAKRLLDYGVHAPTIYFPLIVPEAFMIEPTESESKEELDKYVEALSKVIEECYNNPEIVKKAPHNTSIGRVDEAYGSRPSTMTPSFKWLMKREKLKDRLY